MRKKGMKCVCLLSFCEGGEMQSVWPWVLSVRVPFGYRSKRREGTEAN